VAPGGPTAVWSGLVGSPAMAPEILGNRYEVGRPIGSGAMTMVLEAWDRREHRHVALKVLSDRLAADEAFLERLEREARTAASLTHPNIATVHAVGWDSRTRFVVTELVTGPSLGDMLADRGPLPPVGAAKVAANLCAALAAAHERGVTHGHLTLANVLLAIDGQVKVTDFRLAQAATPSAAVSDPGADLQGIGRCVAAMLTGREPAAGEPIGLGPAVPAELAAIVLRAAGDLETAYRSAAELGRDLDRFLASIPHDAASTVQPHHASGHDRSAMVTGACFPATELVPVTAAKPPARRVPSAVRPPAARQRRGLTLTAGLVVVGLVVVGAAGLLGRQPPGPVTNQALAPTSTATLATTTNQSTTSRAPVTTTSPSTTRTGTASPPLTGRHTTTTGQLVGPGQRIVPNVVGLHRQQAADVLAHVQLDTQMVPTQASDSGQVQRVVAQQPSAGQVLPAGSEVTVLIGTRRPTA
jgi:eukaryotic-like serine/threonine-protein kinase